MIIANIFKLRAWFPALLGCFLAAPAAAQNVTQTITLHPGWNAVWLEVRPEDNSAGSVFGDMPVAGVWTRLERSSSVDFIQNVSEEAFNEAGWQRWLPRSREASFLNTLFAVQANHAYLIRLEGDSSVTWNLEGRPALRRPDWVPDAFNLRGAPVDPALSPTFQSFFRHSPAHYDASGGGLRPVYQLNASTGRWERVNENVLIETGRAYWIFTEGASDYLAPLDARVDLGDGLDFGLELTELDLRLSNRRSSPANAIVVDSAANDGVLALYEFDPQLGGRWPELPAPLAVPLQAGEERRLRLAARRQVQQSNRQSSILSVRDGAGTRLLVPVRSEKVVPAAAQQTGPRLQAPADEARALSGLWVGTATINAVSEAHAADPTIPTPVKSELNLRLILHVDSDGRTRLLKEVIQMWRDGTYTNNASGDEVVDQPGEYVLLTDDSLIPFFSGAAVRDGESVGRRLSTVGYDFPTDADGNFLELAGHFAIDQSLTATITLPHDHPTNPFLHRYHPDHDNLNERFDGPAVEAYATARQIELGFTPSPPDGPAAPDFGYDEMGGNYREVITGIHKNAIHLGGTFRLSRVSSIAELNPSSTP